MDPISTVLSGYLLSISSYIQEDYRARIGLQLTPLVLKHNKMEIPFQHQMWRIKDKSVCELYKQDSVKYSKCTISAKSLFSEICSELTKKKSTNWQHQKYQNMYCNAAITYKPMVATVSEPLASKLDDSEKRCNQLILEVMNNKDKELIAKRDKACNSNK
jgi:hypothetical protein